MVERRPHASPAFAICLLVKSFLLITIPIVPGHGLQSCDFIRFPGIGCDNQLTTSCDVDTQKCVCRENLSVEVKSKCLPFKSINEACLTSRQCTKIGGKCMNSIGGEVRINDRPSSPDSHRSGNNIAEEGTNLLHVLLGLNSGFCQCPDNHYHDLEKRQCVRRVLGGKCEVSADCFLKSHASCDLKAGRDGGGKCLCESGYIIDSSTDSCIAMSEQNMAFEPIYSRGSGSDINQISRIHGDSPHQRSINSICEFGYVFDANVAKCRPLVPHWDANRSWSSLVWKSAVLCIVLVLLMMLVSGLQKARVNENLQNWSRALEAYHSRSGGDGQAQSPGGRPRRLNSDLNSAINEALWTGRLRSDGVGLRTTGHASGLGLGPPGYTPAMAAALPNDQPPSYEEAVGMDIRTNNNPSQSQMTVTPINAVAANGSVNPVITPSAVNI